MLHYIFPNKELLSAYPFYLEIEGNISFTIGNTLLYLLHPPFSVRFVLSSEIRG